MHRWTITAATAFAILLACGQTETVEDRLIEAEKRLAVAEERLAVAEERLAVYERATPTPMPTVTPTPTDTPTPQPPATHTPVPTATPTASAREECNMKIVAALSLIGHLYGDGYLDPAWIDSKTEEEFNTILRNALQDSVWAEEGLPLLMKWVWLDETYSPDALVRDSYFEAMGPIITDIRDGEC